MAVLGGLFKLCDGYCWIARYSKCRCFGVAYLHGYCQPMPWLKLCGCNVLYIYIYIYDMFVPFKKKKLQYKETPPLNKAKGIKRTRLTWAGAGQGRDNTIK